MDLDRYYELRSILQQWRTRLADSIRQRIEGSARWLKRLQAIFENEGAGEEFVLWLDRWCRQAAIQFILRVLFIRVIEDRELLGAVRVRTTDGQKMWAQLTRNLGAARYMQWCFWDAAHLLPDLFGPTDYDLVLPDDDLVQRFLDDVWRRPDPNRPGWLRFDFRPSLEQDDEGFQTRFIGDLYQELDAEIRERYALLQTPEFISQFILQHTLLKRFEEKDFREVMLIDPTCGSGHFVVDAFWLFVARYEQASGKTRDPLSSDERAQIARTVIEKHLFGCDINPYATALTRFRLILAACDYAKPSSLRAFRNLRFNIVTIDSLIPYEKIMAGGVQTGTEAARVLGQPDAIERALPILRRRYDVVAGNPPYIVARDKQRKGIYLYHYPQSASGKFHLGAPFTERFFRLALEGGRIGLINSNAFTKRDFGRTLVQNFLASIEIDGIVDLSDVEIPGHGTPTLIIFGMNQSATHEKIKVAASQGKLKRSNASGQQATWESIVHNYSKPEYEDESIRVVQRSRSEFAKHPWDFSFDKIDLLKRISAKSSVLKDFAIHDGIGISLFTLLDEIFAQPIDAFRRRAIDTAHIRHIVLGEEVRDWQIDPDLAVLFPYLTVGGKPTPIDIQAHRHLLTFLKPYEGLLSGSHTAGSKSRSAGWYEYGRFTIDKYLGHYRIVFSAIATHNHFVIDANTGFRLLFKQSAPLIKLSGDSVENNTVIVALLNSTIPCMHLKQHCYNKGAGDDPIRDRYDLSAQSVALIPIPKQLNNQRLISVSQEIVQLSSSLSSLRAIKLFEKPGEAYHNWNSALASYVPPHLDLPLPFNSAQELRVLRDVLISLRQDMRARMIFLQEETDWLTYEMYGLIDKAPLAENYLTPEAYKQARLELGQRPFEIAGRGYQGDWPEGFQPAPLPDDLRQLIEVRIALIEQNPDIALLEDPLYKRRWVPPDYEQEFREAAEWWLAEKLEWAVEQHGRPTTLREWARIMGRDERVNAVLEVLTGTPGFDLEAELLDVIRANAVPNRPEHYLKPSGLRKLGLEGAEFSRDDFSDGTAWRLRGKLNIPRERFIAYTEFDHALRGAKGGLPDTGGPWFGWAGWDAAKRADALAFLLDRANRAGWEVHWRQCGLRASLRELLPQLTDLPPGERGEFEAIASVCGIGLGTSCYCRSYRDGVARGEPGVIGVGEEVLNIKPLPAEGRKAKRGRKKKTTEEAEQIDMGLDE